MGSRQITLQLPGGCGEVTEEDEMRACWGSGIYVTGSISPDADRFPVGALLLLWASGMAASKAASNYSTMHGIPAEFTSAKVLEASALFNEIGCSVFSDIF